MATASLLLRAQLRTRWRSWLGLAALVGIVAGTVLATMAAARRTETSYERFIADTAAFDVAVANGGTTPDNVNKQFDFSEVARLPQVLDAAEVKYYSPSGRTAAGQAITQTDMAPLASIDGKFGTTVNRAQVLEGRTAINDDEIAVTPLVAQRLHLSVGDTVQLHIGSIAERFGPDPSSRTRPFRVVGLVGMQSGFPPLTGGLPPPVLLSPNYARSHPDAAHVLMVRLHRGSEDVPAFMRELGRLAPGEQIVTANGAEFGAINRSLSLEANALRVVAFLVGVVLVLVLGQVFILIGFAQSIDDEAFHVLGVTRRQLGGIAIQRGILIGAAAALVAIVTAVLLSPLSPIGSARQAEPHPGLALNLAYLGIGSAAIFAITAGLSIAGGVFATRRRSRASAPRRSSQIRETLAKAGLSTPASTGVQMALDPGRGRNAVPVRSTIASATLAIALIVGVVGFSSSLTKLFDDPALYGWNWDMQVGDAFAPNLDDHAARMIANPATRAVAVGTIARVGIHGEQVDLLAIESQKGSIEPVIVAGRAPRTPTEIVLGTRTLRDIDREVGDAVDVDLSDASARFTIVGRAVFPDFAGAARLGEGGATTFAGVQRLQPELASDLILLRVTRDRAGAALLDELNRQLALDVYAPTKPSDLAEVSRIGGLPSILAVLLGGIAITTLAYALVSSVRRRRRDLAILKVLGFGRSQVSAAVTWQSNVIASTAIVLGVPLGVVAGQWAWRVFANQLGVPPRPSLSPGGILVIVVLALVLANATALIPAWLAARTRPTAALRTE